MEIVYGKPAFTFEGKKQSYLCIEIMDICYQIYPRIEYLKTAVDMIIRGKVKWIKREGNNIYNSVFADSIGVNAKQKLDYLIYTIQCNEPSYTSLIIKKEPMSVMNKIFIVGGIVGVLPIVLFILYLILQLIIAFVNKL